MTPYRTSMRVEMAPTCKARRRLDVRGAVVLFGPLLVTVGLTFGSGALLDRCSVLPDVPDASVGR